MEKIRLGIIGGGIGSYIGKAHRIAACMDESYTLMQVLKPGYEYTSKFSVSSTRIAPGHLEGFFEAFANLYKGAAKAIRGQKIEEGEFPTIHDGVRGIRFIEAVVKSSKEGNIWVNV